MKTLSRLLFLISPLLALPLFTRAQEADMDMATLQGVFSTAKETFDSPNQPACIPEFKKIVDALLGKRGRSPDETLLLKKSLEYRARAYFNSGDDATCDGDLRSLIAIDPGYTINRTEVSPKFYGLFENLRKNIIGFLRITTEPQGAAIYLDAEEIGATNLIDLPVVAGAHKMRVSRKGFEEITEDITVVAKETLIRAFPLVRTAASLSVTTKPAEVEVTIDGQAAGKTLAGETDVSRALLIDGLTLGRHILELKRPCYEPTVRAVNIESIQDLEIPTIELESSTGTLTVTSGVAGEATLDGGTSLGRLPVTNAKVCSGAHTVEVSFPAGKYRQEILLARDQSLTLEAVPRPTLVFLGIFSEPALEATAREREEQLAGALNTIATLNILFNDHDSGLKLLRRVGMAPNSFLGTDRGKGDDDKKLFQENVGKLCADLKAEMACVAFLSKERIQENLFLCFATPLSSSVESIYVKPLEDEIKNVVALLNRPSAMYRSWIGCRTVDVAGRAGPVVLAVPTEGPAAAARLSVGQEILEVSGKAVATSADLQSAIALVRPGDKITLRIRDAKKDSPARSVELTMGKSPQELPLNASDILYSKVMADLGVAIKGGANGVAHFLLAQCLMHANDYAGAYSEMQRAQIGGDWGICDGTVAYYKGRILLQLGYKKEAGDAFRQAAAYSRATVTNHDGKPVAEAAQRFLRDLAL